MRFRCRWLLGCAVVAVAFALGGGSAGAQEPAPRAEGARPAPLGGPLRLQAEPGATVTFAARMPARAAGESLHVDAPDDWIVVPVRRGAISTRATSAPALRIVTLVVPRSARAGQYLVRVRLAAQAADSAIVVVAERRVVSIRLLSADEITAAGEPFHARFAVSNEGNAGIGVRLASSTSGAPSPWMSASALVLQPGDEQEVRLRVKTDEDAALERTELIELRAYIGTSDSVAARASAKARVTPVSSRRAPGARLPLRLTARSATVTTPGSSLGGSPSLELAGGAELDADGRRRLDVLARVSGGRQSPFFERDEYRIEYRGERLRFKAGDHWFGLSSLTAPGRGLFGVEVGGSVGPVDVRGYTGRDRRTASGVSEHGGRLGVRLPHGTTLAGTVVTTQGADAASNGTVVGGGATLRPSDWLRLDLEGAGRVDGASATARALTLTASQPWYTLSAMHTSGDSGFVGPWRSSEQNGATLVLRPWRGVALESSWIDSDRTRLRPFEPSGSSRSREAGIRIGALRAAYGRRERRSVWLGERRGGREESVELSARRAVGALDLDARVSSGVVGEMPADENPRFWRVDARASARIGPRVFASVSADHVEGPTIDAPYASRQSIAQFALRLPSIGAGELQLRAYHRERTRPASRYTAIEASLEQRLPFGHIAIVRTRAISGTALAADEGVVQFEYSVPLYLPLPGRSEGGTVSGRVLDAETGRALPRMRVELGGRAVVTDDAGRFVFRDVEPGRAYVSLDRRSLGGDRAVLSGEAVPVTVSAGARARVDLPVARASRLSGVVELFDIGLPALSDTATPALRHAGVAAGALVVLVRDGEERVIRTDAAGHFDLSALPPGRWALVVAESSLPENHRLDRDSVEVELAPGEHHHVDVRIVPRRRVVRMVAQAELTVDDTTSTPVPARVHAMPPAGREAGASTPSAGRPGELQGYYTVTRWDVGLADIALKVYGDATLWPKIYLASVPLVGDPDLVHPGVRLRVPRKAELTAEELSVASTYRARWAARGRTRPSRGARVPAPLQGYYTVTRWDVGLADIALKVYDDATLWPKIWLASRDLVTDPSVLTPGVRLRVPLEAPLTAEERAAAAEHLEGAPPPR